MSVVVNVEAIVRAVGRWQPSDIAYVRRIWFENCEGNSFDMAVEASLQPRQALSEGWPDPNGRFWEVVLVFRQVRDLVLTICGPWDIQTPGFAIEDIRNRQWEGQNLLVYDYEDLTKEGIRFGAKSAEVRSCHITKTPPNSPVVWREYPGEFDGQRRH